jgi:hypothetical protein
MTTEPMTCGACGAEWWGASRHDVLKGGWKFHHGRDGAVFLMCDACERRYAAVWRRRRAHVSA